MYDLVVFFIGSHGALCLYGTLCKLGTLGTLEQLNWKSPTCFLVPNFSGKFPCSQLSSKFGTV